MPWRRDGCFGPPSCAVLTLAMLASPDLAPHAASTVVQTGPRDTIPRVADFVPDGDLSEWRSRPTDEVLPPTPTTPQALIWIGQVDAGLAIAIELRATGAPGNEDVGLSVWLADAESAAFPPIGWGHQFGFETLDSETECETADWGPEREAFCRGWFRRQVEHRARLTPLFERRWVVPATTPRAIVETLARPAFAALAPEVRAKLAPLEPSPEASSEVNARARPVAGTPGALGVEVVVPWEAFPPVRALDLTALRVRVGLVAGARDPEDVGSGPDALANLRPRPLAAPPVYRLTPCGYGLRQIAIFGDPRVGARLPSEQAELYMIPRRTGDVRRLIVIDNEAAGYQYEPDSSSVSPAAFAAEYSVLELGDDGVLCGPFLAYKRGDRVSATVSGTRSDDDNPWPFLVDARHIETRRLEGGDWLVMEGPRVWFSYYGSGQCGACPRVSVRVYHIDAETSAVTGTLDYTQLAGGGVSDVEIEVSDDWTEIIAYESIIDWEDEDAESHWKATRYCFRDAQGGQRPRYDVCGEEEPVPEPPRRLRLEYERFFDP